MKYEILELLTTLVLVPMPHTQMLVTTPDVGHNHYNNEDCVFKSLGNAPWNAKNIGMGWNDYLSMALEFLHSA